MLTRLIRKIQIVLEQYTFKRERCAWCGWYIHPNLLFKLGNRPQKLTYWKEDTGEFVCASCHYLNSKVK